MNIKRILTWSTSIVVALMIVVLAFTATNKQDVSAKVKTELKPITQQEFNHYTYDQTWNVQGVNWQSKEVAAIQHIINQPSAVRFVTYYAIERTTGTPTLIHAALNIDGDLLPIMYQNTTPCPPICFKDSFTSN